EALEIAPHCRHREHPALAEIRDACVALRETAVDLDLVPSIGVADVVDRNVVVLAPEEREEAAGFVLPQDVPRRDLALALGYHPVLDADPLAGKRVGPACVVAGGEDVR